MAAHRPEGARHQAALDCPAEAQGPLDKERVPQINLRWHDLRHEYASRLVERGVPLAQVRDLLGHASITTTERYDNQKLENLQIAAAKLESGLTFEPPAAADAEPQARRIQPDRGTLVRRSRATDSTARRRCKVSRILQVPGGEPRSRTVREVPAIEPNELEDLDLTDWLGFEPR